VVLSENVAADREIFAIFLLIVQEYLIAYCSVERL
jgi:hypothetical protein